MGGWVEGGRCMARDLKHVKSDHKLRYSWTADWLVTHHLGPSKVLDLCSGTGYGAKILAERGHSVTCVEVSIEAVQVGEEHFRHPRVRRLIGDVTHLSFPLGFDVVTCFEALEHLEHPGPVLSRAALAAPVLFASVPNEDVVHFDARRHAYHFRHYTHEDLRRLLSPHYDVVFLGSHGRKTSIDWHLGGRTLFTVATSRRWAAAGT